MPCGLGQQVVHWWLALALGECQPMGWTPGGAVAAVIAGRPGQVLQAGTTTLRMTQRAKLIDFGQEVRRGLERGMNVLGDTVKVTAASIAALFLAAEVFVADKT